MRRISKVADSSQYFMLRPISASVTRPCRSRSGCVPGGHLPVYVGEEMEWFVVSAELLNHSIFVKLLNKSAQEYIYEQQSVLQIPCHVSVFERVLETLWIGWEPWDLQDLLNSLSDISDFWLCQTLSLRD